MATLVFRCAETGRLSSTEIEIKAAVFRRLRQRIVHCRLCGQSHPWEIVDELPPQRSLCSQKAEDCLGHSIENEELAAATNDSAARRTYQFVADQWARLADHYENSADGR